MMLSGLRVLRQAAVIACAGLILTGCAERRETPCIGYVYPAGDASMHAIALLQQEIDGWNPTRVAEIRPFTPPRGRTGYSAEVAMAEAVTSVDRMVGVVGHLSSRASLVAAPIYQEAGLPLLVPTGTSARLREVGPAVFPVAPNEEAEGEFIAAFVVNRLGAGRVTVFYLFGDEYGIGLRSGVVEGLRKRGLAPSDEVGVLDDSDMSELVAASVARAAPDAVVIAGRNAEAARIAVALHGLAPGVPVVAGDGVELRRDYGRRLGPAADSFYAVAFWHPDLASPASNAFMARWRSPKAPEPTGGTIMYYDGMRMLAEAVREVGTSRSAIRRYLSELGASRPPYAGVSGPISFTRERTTNLLMTRMADDRVVIADHR